MTNAHQAWLASVPEWANRTLPFRGSKLTFELFAAVNSISGVSVEASQDTWLDYCELVYKRALTASQAGDYLGRLLESRSGYNFGVMWDRFNRGVPLAYDSPILRALGFDVDTFIKKHERKNSND